MEEHFNLVSYLRAAAEHIEKYDKLIWNAVLNELDEGNRHWAKNPIGHSYVELAQKEIRRLYALEKTISEMLTNYPKKQELRSSDSVKKVIDRINHFTIMNPGLPREVTEMLLIARDELERE